MLPIIRKEILDSMRNRWIVGYTVIIAVLGLAAALVGVRSTGGMALQIFGRTTATLTNLSLLLAPLVSLVVGANALAGERDRGTLSRLLSLPISTGELVCAKFLGLLFTLYVATLIGFAPAGIVIAVNAGWLALLRYLLFPFVTLLLLAAMLGLGLLVSSSSRTAVKALGSAIILWFAFVLLYDLLLIGTLAAFDMAPGALAVLLIANPVDAARVLVVLLLEPDLYALGPAGVVLVTSLSRVGAAFALGGALLVWSIVPLMLAVSRFRTMLFGRTARRSSTTTLEQAQAYTFAPGTNPINE